MDSDLYRFKELARVAFTCPAIDNHTHPLLKESKRNALPFEGLLTEAHGDDLTDEVIHSLAAYRATRQLAKLFQCEDSWDAVKAKRQAMDYMELCKMCMLPTCIQCVLLDDYLDADSICEDLGWHDQFTLSPSKRIVRVEVVAQNLILGLMKEYRGVTISSEQLLAALIEEFKTTLTQYTQDDNVVGFKSVVCYRTGLDISLSCTDQELLPAFDAALSSNNGSFDKLRLAEKVLNDHLVRITLEIAASADLPVQFHTGLGDNDIDLSRANPALMQPIIKAFPQTKFVLLHSSYPFTQEAGYLATVYKNVYLDFGEVFPLVSAPGQRSIVRKVLELCPVYKIMWSTDGHWWPETYYLGTLQAREVLYDVLSDSVQREELSESQAVSIVQRALFDNANKLYKLGLTRDQA